MPYATVPAQFYSGSQNVTPPPDPYKNYTNIGNNQYLTKNQQLITGDPNNPQDPLGLNVQRNIAGGTGGGVGNPIGSYQPVATPQPSGGLFGVPWLTNGRSAGAAAGTLGGAPPFGYSPSAGGIPQVPNPGVSAGGAIGGNLGNLGNLGQLSQGIGGINAGLGQQPYIQNLPGYQGLLNQASANTQSLLGGNIPADVLTQIQQAGAERGVATGAPGSPNANAAMLRALGLTSLGLQQQGQQNFAQLRGQTPTGPVFNPASMLVDPNMQQQAQAAANLYNAAPNPQAAQNAAFRAMNQGLNRGQGATQPTQSGSLVQDILNRYAPTATGGTPAYPSNVPTGVAGTGQAGTYYAPPPVDYANISDEQLYNLMMGELPQQQQAPTDYGSGDFYSGIRDTFPEFSDYYDLGGG